MCFLGSSGCGKSTLLNCIAGLARRDGRPNPHQWHQRHVGRTVGARHRDGFPILCALSANERSRGTYPFGLKNAKMPKEEIESARRRGPLRFCRSSLCSQPQTRRSFWRAAQRVAIGRALVRDVDVFLFDEPLSNLDAKLRADLRVEIKRLHQQLGNTMIYVTHDQIEAMTLADRIAVMRNGKIMQLASPNEIYNRPRNKYVANFIGSPSMNFLDGQIQDNHFIFEDVKLPLDRYEFSEQPANNCAATIGIRPEHVIVGDLSAKAPYHTQVTVDLVEPMGSDTIVDCTVSGAYFRFRMDGQARVKPGDLVSIGFDPKQASLFDPASELRL